jgi:hypothetical protein
LDDDDPKLVKLMIDYFYLLEYDDSVELKPMPNSTSDSGSHSEESVGSTKAVFGDEVSEPQGTEIDVAAPEQPPNNPAPETAVDEWADWFIPPKKKKGKGKNAVEEQADIKKLTTNTLMYALADKYSIDDLQKLAKSKFQLATTGFIFNETFADVARLVFDTTPRPNNGLRDVVVEVLNEHRGLLDYSSVRELCESDNGLAWRLLQRMR